MRHGTLPDSFDFQFRLRWSKRLHCFGIVLLVLLFVLHLVSEWGLIWRNAQQRHHTIIATAVAIAGGAELLSSASPARRRLPLGLCCSVWFWVSRSFLNRASGYNISSAQISYLLG